ncbi:MAG: ATP-dependent protease subunit HslV [Dehalococcoidia bacterium]
MAEMRATTVIAVRLGGAIAMAGDGQITVGDTIMKQTAVKIRAVHNGRVLAGFAGSVADALTLFDRFEIQLERNGGHLRKSAISLAKDWRTDRFLRRLEAQLVLGDPETLLLVNGEGEIIEPDNNVVAIGSGGTYALAAAQALLRYTSLSAAEVARASMEIAGSICIYTNDQITLQCIDAGQPAGTAEEGERV